MSYQIGSATKEEWAARCKVAEDRVAGLEEALLDIAQMHGENPSLAMADMDDADYQRYTLNQARRTARKALGTKT